MEYLQYFSNAITGQINKIRLNTWSAAFVIILFLILIDSVLKVISIIGLIQLQNLIQYINVNNISLLFYI